MRIDNIRDVANDPLILRKERQAKVEEKREHEAEVTELRHVEEKEEEENREERVNAIREQVANGSYHVNSYDVADKFLRGTLIGFA